MNDSHPQSALREWRAHLRQPVTLIALAGVASVLALVGPYGTDTLLRPLPRLGYWVLTVSATYALSWLAIALVRRVIPRRWPRAARVILSGLASGATVALLVLAINAAALDYWPDGPERLAIGLNVLAIAMIVTVVLNLLDTTPSPGAAPAPSPPAILDRLPLDKRRPLLALSVQDHYVDVRTTRGTEMLLMRLSDAMREVGDTPGAQVHRAHWVAFGQVTAARRTGDRAILTLSDGSELPVSRANLPLIKEAGLLPR